MKKVIVIIVAMLILASFATAQIPTATHIQILKAEDARRYDKTLEDLLRSQNADVRERAALAAGRIGRQEAIPPLVSLLTNDPSVRVRVMAAFALGESESIKAADSILKTLETAQTHDSVRARTVEAAGKVAAANPKDEKSKELGAAILKAVDFENAKRSAPSIEIIRPGMTAILRAKPAGGEDIARKFLRDSDPNIVADALNTLARLRAKNANSEARELLKTHADPIVRANAARVLGAAEDKDALEILLKAATTDKDSRVRVAAIRSLGSLKDARAADRLLDLGKKLLTEYSRSKSAHPTAKNELLEIATTLGRLLEASNDESAVTFLDEFRNADRLRSPEPEIAFARISPKTYLDRHTKFIALFKGSDWRAFSSVYQGMAHIAGLDTNESNKAVVQEVRFRLLKFAEGWFWSSGTKKTQGNYKMAVPDLLRAMAAKKPGDSSGIFRPMLDRENDVFIRATLAELLSEQPKSKENLETLVVAFAKSLDTDKNDNDAQLAILDALYKLDKREAVGSLLRALNASDYLVRKKAFQLLTDDELSKEFPEIVSALSLARGNGMDELLPRDAEIMQMTARSATKLGQILNTDADYRRALARKNGSVKAVLRSEKGTFTIDFYPEEAPLTVDNFIKLARSKYFDGLEVHRVVPNFVMQDGDPRGDGNGGPGWSIRCEVNMLPYERGAVGMALSGKDTGGSQWFVTHSPQPHLDGGYTVFGRVSETDMKVVDSIVRGDKILSVKIIGR